MKGMVYTVIAVLIFVTGGKMVNLIYIPIAWIVGGIFLIIMGIREANAYYGGKKYSVKQFLRFLRRWG